MDIYKSSLIISIIIISFVIIKPSIYSTKSSKKNNKSFQNRGIQIIDTKPILDITKKKHILHLNNVRTFQKVKKRDAYVFMIGNNDYDITSGFIPLKQAYNDITLLTAIFNKCVKIDLKNIYSYKDLTLQTFNKHFNDFISKIDSESLVIITYSGHGHIDGSFVFVDGSKLSSEDLKSKINSIKNDTILLIDACYSGNNEGPKLIYESNNKTFKSNSLRIYASLAHLSAKEINYSNIYFKRLKPFYNEFLGIKKIDGNGYFTAMIGFFFATYNFKEDENISFKDLVYFITSKGKQYIEFLAVTGISNIKNINEATIRLHQQPKILPIKEKVSFINQNHQFLILQKLIEDRGIELGLFGGIFFPLGNLGSNYQNGIAADIFINYEAPFILKNFYFQLHMNYFNLSLISSSNKRNIVLNIIAPTIGVQYHFLKNKPVSVSTEVGLGAAFTIENLGSFGTIKEESLSFTNFYFQSIFNLYFHPTKYFHIMLPIKFAYIYYKDSALYGISINLGIGYYF